MIEYGLLVYMWKKPQCCFKLTVYRDSFIPSLGTFHYLPHDSFIPYIPGQIFISYFRCFFFSPSLGTIVSLCPGTVLILYPGIILFLIPGPFYLSSWENFNPYLGSALSLIPGQIVCLIPGKVLSFILRVLCLIWGISIKYPKQFDPLSWDSFVHYPGIVLIKS